MMRAWNVGMGPEPQPGTTVALPKTLPKFRGDNRLLILERPRIRIIFVKTGKGFLCFVRGEHGRAHYSVTLSQVRFSIAAVTRASLFGFSFDEPEQDDNNKNETLTVHTVTPTELCGRNRTSASRLAPPTITKDKKKTYHAIIIIIIIINQA